MTVKQLIKTLEKLDQDRIVLLRVNAQEYLLAEINRCGTGMVFLMPPTYHDKGDRVEHWYNEGDERYHAR